LPAPEPHDELSDTLLLGTPYKPIAKLGQGGMGEVVAAEHVALGKPVVIKLLHRDLARQPHHIERMRVEAQTLARIAHPNLVAVTDFGQTPEGRPYIVMERLRGRTLKDELSARGHLPLVEAVEDVRQILAGLHAAHGLGLVHRDVKLENLFICDADEKGVRLMKVLDFGIAKVVGQGAGNTPLPSKYPTAEGVLLGTPRFLSPEQATGKPVDVRTDVYSTGLVLYMLLTGKGPFQDLKSLAELLRAHAVVDPPAPSKVAPQNIPAEVDRVVLKSLSKRPEDRYQDAAAFSTELAAAMDRAKKPVRWEHTEPLASSPKAQRIAEVARAVMERAPTQPVAMPPGAVRQPPTAAMVASPQQHAHLAATAHMDPTPNTPRPNRLAATAPLDPGRHQALGPATPFHGRQSSPGPQSGQTQNPPQNLAPNRASTPAALAVPRRSSAAPLVVLLMGLLVLAGIAASWFFVWGRK
jgi:eukaryotic-like serine/threonine-protein kinase